MSVLILTLIVWGCCVVLLSALLIYRALLGTSAEQLVFFHSAEAGIDQHQLQRAHRIDRVDEMVKWLAIAACALLLLAGGMWIWNGLFGRM